MYRQLIDWWNMKTHSIKYDTSLKQGYKSNPAITKKEYSAGLCENNNRGYSVAFSGSGAGTSEAAAKVFKNLGNTFSDKIFRSEKFKKIVEIFENKTVVAQSLVALVVAGVLRPATNMAMAGKDDREDSMYAASHAIASAVIGFLVSATVMAPFDKAFRKIKEDPKKYMNSKKLTDLFGEIGKRKLEKSAPYKKLSKAAQMIPDTFVLGIPKAMLTIALIPPILKYVFGMERKPKGSSAQLATGQANDFMNPSITKFLGGNK